MNSDQKTSERGNVASIVDRLSRDNYKTVMCKNYLTLGYCMYGSICKYAHGDEELRQHPREAANKNIQCKYFTIGCRKGDKCQYFHPINTGNLLPSALNSGAGAANIGTGTGGRRAMSTAQLHPQHLHGHGPPVASTRDSISALTVQNSSIPTLQSVIDLPNSSGHPAPKGRVGLYPSTVSNTPTSQTPPSITSVTASTLPRAIETHQDHLGPPDGGIPLISRSAPKSSNLLTMSNGATGVENKRPEHNRQEHSPGGVVNTGNLLPSALKAASGAGAANIGTGTGGRRAMSTLISSGNNTLNLGAKNTQSHQVQGQHQTQTPSSQTSKYKAPNKHTMTTSVTTIAKTTSSDVENNNNSSIGNTHGLKPVVGSIQSKIFPDGKLSDGKLPMQKRPINQKGGGQTRRQPARKQQQQAMAGEQPPNKRKRLTKKQKEEHEQEQQQAAMAAAMQMRNQQRERDRTPVWRRPQSPPTDI